MPGTTDSPWLSTAALAAELDMPESTLRYWRHVGRGPRGLRLGRQVRYARADVESWLEHLAAEEDAARPDADPLRTSGPASRAGMTPASPRPATTRKRTA
ncbi:helix-turn-helix domain-containing protein [Georgenia daeguensis]|uniref:Helix-turn-helix domain-containing protein n=1 Tax=Georgenia daeguensis TaxID=908355 RepID=A0ABP8EQ87_9MICO